MEKITFLVQGSASIPYIIDIFNDEKAISIMCTCAAGLIGQPCKHRLSILSGSAKNIVSNNVEDIDLVISWLSGSKLKLAIDQLAAAEIEFEQAKSKVLVAKKSLSITMKHH